MNKKMFKISTPEVPITQEYLDYLKTAEDIMERELTDSEKKELMLQFNKEIKN